MIIASWTWPGSLLYNTDYCFIMQVITLWWLLHDLDLVYNLIIAIIPLLSWSLLHEHDLCHNLLIMNMASSSHLLFHGEFALCRVLLFCDWPLNTTSIAQWLPFPHDYCFVFLVLWLYLIVCNTGTEVFLLKDSFIAIL